MLSPARTLYFLLNISIFVLLALICTSPLVVVPALAAPVPSPTMYHDADFASKPPHNVSTFASRDIRPFGVVRKPLRVDIVPEVLEPFSLGLSSPLSRIFRTWSISASVRFIRSRRFFHRCADSACRRRVSPFFVTRSRTPLSMIDRTFEVAGM